MAEPQVAIPKAGDLGRSTCRAPECKREILWARTRAGKLIPLDPEPERRIVLVTKAGPTDSPELVAESLPTYMPHHATCPGAERFRRVRG
jgi:hypothetical protein